MSVINDVSVGGTERAGSSVYRSIVNFDQIHGRRLGKRKRGGNRTNDEDLILSREDADSANCMRLELGD